MLQCLRRLEHLMIVRITQPFARNAAGRTFVQYFQKLVQSIAGKTLRNCLNKVSPFQVLQKGHSKPIHMAQFIMIVK